MTEETKKPAAKRATTKKGPPIPWSYAQQLSFLDAAKHFVRAQAAGDAVRMQELRDRMEEDLKLGMGV